MAKDLIYIICPVGDITDDEKEFIEKYVAKLESEGYSVHSRPRRVNQNDSSGLNILLEDRKAMKISKEVHVYWKGHSTGNYFEFGMAFMNEKPINLFNREMIKKTPHKSFENVLLEIDFKK